MNQLCMIYTNICFSTTMTSADVAAWVEAIGTVMAIVAAIGITQWQMHVERKRQRDERKATKEKTYGTAVMFGAVLSETIKNMQRACDAHDQFWLEREGRTVEALAQWGIQLEPVAMSTAAAISFLRLRVVASEVHFFVTKRTSGISFKNASDTLRGHVNRAQHLVRAVASEAEAEGLHPPLLQADAPSSNP